MSNIDEQIDDKLAALSSQGGVDTPASFPAVDPGVGPLICPGCVFPKGPLPDGFDIESRMKGAYLPLVQFLGTDLLGVDLSDAYLGGAQIHDVDLSGAILTDANFSAWIQKSWGNEAEISTTFSNTNLLNAVFNGDEDGLDKVDWKNGTTCPDGSRIPQDVTTCLGHLEPRDP